MKIQGNQIGNHKETTINHQKIVGKHNRKSQGNHNKSDENSKRSKDTRRKSQESNRKIIGNHRNIIGHQKKIVCLDPVWALSGPCLGPVWALFAYNSLSLLTLWNLIRLNCCVFIVFFNKSLKNVRNPDILNIRFLTWIFFAHTFRRGLVTGPSISVSRQQETSGFYIFFN